MPWRNMRGSISYLRSTFWKRMGKLRDKRLERLYRPKAAGDFQVREMRSFGGLALFSGGNAVRNNFRDWYSANVADFLAMFSLRDALAALPPSNGIARYVVEQRAKRVLRQLSDFPIFHEAMRHC